MKELATEEGFEPLTPGQRAEVGDRVEVTVPPGEHVDQPGKGTIIRIVYSEKYPFKIFFVIRMDPVDVDLCDLPGIVHVAGPKYWRSQIAVEEDLIWLGEHIHFENCDLCLKAHR
jgi:hypothetical protein